MFTLIPRLIFTVIIKGFFEGFIKRIIESISKSFFKGINQASPNDFTPQLHHHFHLCVINIILNGILKGIIVVSLRVIDGGFCPGNELLTLRRGLRHSRYVFLSDRLLELGIGYWVSASIPRCRPESSPVPLLNPSSRWYNPLTTNDKAAQEDEKS
jgi:hypothetical protein